MSECPTEVGHLGSHTLIRASLAPKRASTRLTGGRNPSGSRAYTSSLLPGCSSCLPGSATTASPRTASSSSAAPTSPTTSRPTSSATSGRCSTGRSRCRSATCARATTGARTSARRARLRAEPRLLGDLSPTGTDARERHGGLTPQVPGGKGKGPFKGPGPQEGIAAAWYPGMPDAKPQVGGLVLPSSGPDDAIRRSVAYG